MKISIITACYNSASTIEATIRSVLEQTHLDIEYIVVDGQSTDGTLAILEKYKNKISKLISEKDQGMYFAVNKAITLATGEVIGMLNSDDFYVDENVLALVANEFESGNIDSLYGDLQYVSKENAQKIVRHWKSKSYSQKLFLQGWMPPHPTFFVRRKCYEQYGAFNTSFSISADYELMLRLLYKHKISSSYLPKVLVKMRTGGISNASAASRLKANREDRRAWKINGLKPGILTFVRKPLSKIKQYFIN